jgi:serine/threonine-protein phosphatase 2A regulatory subunit B
MRSSPDEIPWCFSQVKGTIEDEVADADIISTVEFNHDGEFLATGDKGGRVVVFQRDSTRGVTKSNVFRCDYNVYSTFQSHEPEFDYLKSLEIEEKINQICWVKQSGSSLFLLTTNDKTIKLWKITERCRRFSDFNTFTDEGLPREKHIVRDLKLPRKVDEEISIEAMPRRIFSNAHTYHINSISVNSDDCTFLSADDLRINVWHLETTEQSFNIVDIKPANMEELTEVITATRFHPYNCHEFIYSSSKGTIRLCDMREKALCDQHAKLFEEPEDPSSRSFFSEIIASISDVRFSRNGRYILSRDYLTVKLWDVTMENRPVEVYPVHDYLRSRLCSLYENDCIFDKFECGFNGDDSKIITGTYNNFFRIFDRQSNQSYTYEASRDMNTLGQILRNKKVVAAASSSKKRKDEVPVEQLEYARKILHPVWHPKDNILAIAATNNLYLFHEQQP